MMELFWLSDSPSLRTTNFDSERSIIYSNESDRIRNEFGQNIPNFGVCLLNHSNITGTAKS